MSERLLRRPSHPVSAGRHAACSWWPGCKVLQDGDAVAIFNFRADRVLEISRAFEYETFDKFDRKRHPKARAPPVGPACTAAATVSPEWVAARAWGRCALRG